MGVPVGGIPMGGGAPQGSLSSHAVAAPSLRMRAQKLLEGQRGGGARGGAGARSGPRTRGRRRREGSEGGRKRRRRRRRRRARGFCCVTTGRALRGALWERGRARAPEPARSRHRSLHRKPPPGTLPVPSRCRPNTTRDTARSLPHPSGAPAGDVAIRHVRPGDGSGAGRPRQAPALPREPPRRRRARADLGL